MLGIHFLKVRESNTNDEQQFSYNPLVIKHEKFLKKTCTLYLDFSTLIILFLTPLMLFSHFALGHQENHFRRICPGCPHQHIHNILRKEISPSPDDLRLEAIKHQILTKLGLRNRPDVNKTMTQVPRHLALETLYRAEAHPNENLGERNTYFEKDHRKDGISDFFFTSYKYSYENRESEELMTQKIMSTESLEKIENDGRHRSTEIEIDDFYARTSEIITFAEPGKSLNNQPLLEFPMTSSEPTLEPLRIKRATLWVKVFMNHLHYHQIYQWQRYQKNITLWVFKVHCGNSTHLRGKELSDYLEMVTSVEVNVGQFGWQKFDVTNVVNSWYLLHKIAQEKLTLLVDCTGCGTQVHISTFSEQTQRSVDSSIKSKDAENSNRPFLVVLTDPAAVKRVRRRAIECSGALKGQCCKQRFYVSFSQLGWDDWIIAPQGYYANYCRGDCAAGHRTPDTFLNYYTHVIEEYRKMDKLAGMQPCCAPLKFSPMSLIYYGPDSNIIKRDLPKMIVDECGCP
ncbi:inhibin beta chain [Chelonus insularis]|uniref:inhibin beta chain n=1 Tax=Chelonus insularis TaxID=460826 RepID=UPI00158CB5CA|nr:inhibin beta chain [Chelonus insularis]